MLHFWCKGAAPLPALLFKSLYCGFSGGRRTSFLHSIILNRRSRQFFILHSSFFILHSHCCMALCEPAATELKSKKRSRNISGFFSESFGFVFWFFFLIFFWHGLYLDRTNGILYGFVYWSCLHIKWFVWGRLVFNLIYANVFFEH